MITSEYIIDFERLNQLTVHPQDNPNSGAYQPAYCFSTTRKIIKEYMEIYTGNSPRQPTPDQYTTAVETLHYNKILLSKADIRDNKIKTILE